MDWQKTMLIAAMCAVVFTLIIRWTDFQETVAPAERLPAAERRATSPSPERELPDVTDSGVSELPTAPDEQLDVPEQDIDLGAAYARTVSVTTDTLEVDIDLRGGDIVYLALPQHHAKLNRPDVPFVMLNDSDFQTYVSQSGLVGRNGTDTREGRPVFNAEATEYRLEEGEDQLQVDLTLNQNGVDITKRFIFTRGDYLVDVVYLIDNQTDQPWQASLYGQIKRDSSEAGDGPGGLFALNPYLGAALTTADTRYKRISFSDMRDGGFQTTHEGGWVAMIQHYFVSAWVPSPDATHNYHLRQLGNQDMYLMGFTSPSTRIGPGEQGTISASFYSGPKYTHRLAEISPYLDLTVDYGWLWWLAKPLFTILNWIHGFLGNWGLAIIALTIVIKAAFFKLSATSYRSMAKMRKLSPMMAELKERYGDDRQKMSQELMKLYKKEKVNPLGGCLPILVQMPVFLALYWVLMESVELRHAPFFLWIQDLSVRDPYFVLPLLMGLTMFIQFKLNPTPPDPTQAKIMQMMPIVFTFLFLFFPAGLVLYWVTNNALSIAQQYVITRNIENEGKPKTT
ncbi:membrane protein insertase YidC [Marinimicrobium sp. ABcell2]|uniref:membrane protein insertase YidC n=1 Tax=Marinimicrobium sp. ABcell2 TaxID=3069751 RepID=UPI0027B6BF87|nr:membrane protein insertase YidC [Marinimicrobium sp. ABcell2]MDQ2077036.1 membrane protein insertase YidC [Marinimicrobium sp. ABcell2]